MTTLSIDIRRAEPEDADAIAAVHDRAWRGAYAGIIPHRALNAMIGRRGPQWWANAIRRSTTVLLLEVGGELAGYATLGRSRARDLAQAGEIYELYLSPEFQGIGFGHRLFRAAKDMLGAHGFSGLVVWVLEENDPARAFYERIGGRDAADSVEIFDNKALRKIAYVWD
ncbi:N-acetyltransferase GCN5 [Nitratireductor aestuarii]|uniref:N-acetyltransferase GCN5 n=1 Tax=Nitratireductor aestuarii TaxID=1735103 RepID=A0A916RK57_9HYPH|nr:GNAT family N-acetyltransferase [Nitratireductor aestuarii]GGA56717.1 N-acetyltransferase GCN5 [Nitratireductor aestuarii]